MLFNSVEFIFGFFPLAVLVFFALGRSRPLWAAGWLALASLAFYGWWSPKYVLLLLGSIAFNYSQGLWIGRVLGSRGRDAAKWVLTFGVVANLALLGYFKYANFFLDTWTRLSGSGFTLGHIILPLGISFFTFTQIAFLVDVYRGFAKEYNLVHYALFVTYFPHLIAGPVLHHKEMMPQFQDPSTYRLDWGNVAVGLGIFGVGLAKKTLLADGVAPYATPLFSAPGAPDLLSAWGGALAYTLQLYFDFSGYSDMAIGLSRVFGIRLPLNFNSPYKAVNIIDFWRRWHMTLSRFLRDYLYIALGGNRKGPARRHVNLLTTMVLGGLWHGAGWTFVIWGALHGVYLVINHGWQVLRGSHAAGAQTPGTAAGVIVARLLTFVAVVVGWVFFRAASLDDALAILRGMAGQNGLALPSVIGAQLGALQGTLERLGVTFDIGGTSRFVLQYAWIAFLLPLTWLAPNTQEIFGHFRPALDFASHPARRLAWRPTAPWGAAIGLLTAVALLSLSRVTDFLYYQF